MEVSVQYTCFDKNTSKLIILKIHFMESDEKKSRKEIVQSVFISEITPNTINVNLIIEKHQNKNENTEIVVLYNDLIEHCLKRMS